MLVSDNMKRWLLFFILFLGTGGQLLAQEGFHLGPALGFHNSWLANRDDREDEEIEGRFTPGGSGALYLAYFIKPGIAVAAEGIFSFQGQNYYYDRRYEDQRASTRLSYFKVPLMLEFRTSLKEESFIKGHFGPYLSSVQTASRSREGKSLPSREGDGWEQAYRTPVFGVMLGLGPGIRWGRGWASTLELRFDHDLTNAEEKASRMIPNQREETYNATLGIMLRLRYAFQKRSAKNRGGYP